MESSKLEEEKLREGACYGDLDSVRVLVTKGVNINSQHSINGWLVQKSFNFNCPSRLVHTSFNWKLFFRTALHWAAKRNHLDVAHYLLSNGADKDIESFAKELPADLATSPAVLNLLGSPKTKAKTEDIDKDSFIPHYLSKPVYGYKVDLDDHSKAASSFQDQFPKSESSDSFKQPRGSCFFKQLVTVFTVFSLRTGFQAKDCLLNRPRLH